MTIKPQKPNRTEFEKVERDKVRYLRRKQDEEEDEKYLEWCLTHEQKEEDAASPEVL